MLWVAVPCVKRELKAYLFHQMTTEKRNWNVSCVDVTFHFHFFTSSSMLLRILSLWHRERILVTCWLTSFYHKGIWSISFYLARGSWICFLYRACNKMSHVLIDQRLSVLLSVTLLSIYSSATVNDSCNFIIWQILQAQDIISGGKSTRMLKYKYQNVKILHYK